MQFPVNFLPWRQQRRNACVRFWSGMFSASAVIVLALTLSGYAADSMSGRVNGVLLRAEQQLAAALATEKPRLEITGADPPLAGGTGKPCIKLTRAGLADQYELPAEHA